MRTDGGANLRYAEGIARNVDVRKIKKAGLSVVIDCANGVAGLVTPALLKKIGIKVIALNQEPDGRFPGHRWSAFDHPVG